MAPRRPGRDQPPVTQDALVQAALVVLERDGLDALSMRRVAGELGLQAARCTGTCGTRRSSSSWSRTPSLAGMDRRSGRGLAGAGVGAGPPLPRAAEVAADVPRLIAGRFVLGAMPPTMMEDVLGEFLRQAGFSPGGAAAAMYLFGDVRAGLRGPGDDPDASGRSAGWYARRRDGGRDRRARRPPGGAFPAARRGGGYLTAMDLDERFDWGLECLLDGLELRLAGSRAAMEPGGPENCVNRPRPGIVSSHTPAESVRTTAAGSPSVATSAGSPRSDPAHDRSACRPTIGTASPGARSPGARSRRGPWRWAAPTGRQSWMVR